MFVDEVVCVNKTCYFSNKRVFCLLASVTYNGAIGVYKHATPCKQSRDNEKKGHIDNSRAFP